jgi:hypothetical protein
MSLLSMLKNYVVVNLRKRGWLVFRPEHCSQESPEEAAIAGILRSNGWIIHQSEQEMIDIVRQEGFVVLRPHFYHPIPLEEDIVGDFFMKQSSLVGIHMNAAAMWELAEIILAPYNEEFRAFPTYREDKGGMIDGFFLINGSYMAVDGNVYYGLVRHLKPKRIIEVGCGMSTLLCSEALARNVNSGYTTDYTCIEPYPQEFLSKYAIAGDINLLTAKIQDIDIKLIETLSAGDILFVDTSHALRLGGDVQFIYCELLPRLKPGVYVHIHDISLPLPYPRVYYETGFYWNEQYLLHAYLCNNARAEVIWAGNWLRLQDESRFAHAFPEFATMRENYPQSEPSAFWFKTI